MNDAQGHILAVAHEHFAALAEDDPWLALIREEFQRLETENAVLRANQLLHLDGVPPTYAVHPRDAGEYSEADTPTACIDPITHRQLTYRELDAALRRERQRLDELAPLS